MPRFDGTGPLGLGPLTGWGLGPCGRGLGFRRGLRQGLGWWRWIATQRKPLTKSEEIKTLEEEARILEEELKIVKEEIAKLKGTKK